MNDAKTQQQLAKIEEKIAKLETVREMSEDERVEPYYAPLWEEQADL